MEVLSFNCDFVLNPPYMPEKPLAIKLNRRTRKTTSFKQLIARNKYSDLSEKIMKIPSIKKQISNKYQGPKFKIQNRLNNGRHPISD